MVDVPNIADNLPVVGSALAQYIQQAAPLMDYDGFTGQTSTVGGVTGRVQIPHNLGVQPTCTLFLWVQNPNSYFYELQAASTAALTFQFLNNAHGVAVNGQTVAFNWFVIA